ncbi:MULTISPECIES: class I SAM-dependent methyltransferase [unclassified Saccharopolyspora]|uniref:class I SAM-dependent methyltransferase n=1 Tax=Saccharopolyspora TaxID=1835 RepID=UPI00190D8D05|nr:class I SAM-dependent methyltransferase [Saccharopolyspora sp. HNM0986]MBK0867903.1 class I SAM-dependent methyltransferase [Saccharopolyspora sp. HNM0986]
MSPQDRNRAIPALFDQGGRDYDRLVAANPGYHRHLALSARRLALRGGGRGLRLLDVGCGTGASTRALLDAAPHASIVAVDGSQRMLAEARGKAWPQSVRFVHADVRSLSEAGVHGPFDGILAAYLLRNLPDPSAGLRLLHDLLRPGAPLAVHDYSLPLRLADRLLWHAVCRAVIMPLARLSTGETELYRHLWRSVLEFDHPERLLNRMRKTGFAAVRVEPMSGWQRTITHTFLGVRPESADA